MGSINPWDATYSKINKDVTFSLPLSLPQIFFHYSELGVDTEPSIEVGESVEFHVQNRQVSDPLPCVCVISDDPLPYMLLCALELVD